MSLNRLHSKRNEQALLVKAIIISVALHIAIYTLATLQKSHPATTINIEIGLVAPELGSTNPAKGVADAPPKPIEPEKPEPSKEQPLPPAQEEPVKTPPAAEVKEVKPEPKQTKVAEKPKSASVVKQEKTTTNTKNQKQPPAETSAKTNTSTNKTQNANDQATAADNLAAVRNLVNKQRQTQGIASGSETGFGLPSGVEGRLYFRELELAVRQVWRVPPGSTRNVVDVEVIINRQGQLTSRVIRQSSGDPLLDRSALSALDAADLPPPPADFQVPLRIILRLIPPDNS